MLQCLHSCVSVYVDSHGANCRTQRDLQRASEMNERSERREMREMREMRETREMRE
jgi:hypothetical protein